MSDIKSYELIFEKGKITDLDIRLIFHAQGISKEPVIPLLYNRITVKEPYRLTFMIIGELDDIEPLSAKFIINNKQEIKVSIPRNEWEKKQLQSGETTFAIANRYFDFPWHEIIEVKFIFEFYCIKDEESIYYKEEQIFKPIYETILTSTWME